jgi:hypothetical protein
VLATAHQYAPYDLEIAVRNLTVSGEKGFMERVAKKVAVPDLYKFFPLKAHDGLNCTTRALRLGITGRSATSRA